MAILAMSPATATTIADILVFFVAFPPIIGGIIAFAVIVAHGEESRYEESRRHTPLEPPHRVA
jgi:hypothetical protein